MRERVPVSQHVLLHASGSVVTGAPRVGRGSCAIQGREAEAGAVTSPTTATGLERPRLPWSHHQVQSPASLPSQVPVPGRAGPVSLSGFLSRLVFSLPASVRAAPAETLSKGNRSVTQTIPAPAATSSAFKAQQQKEKRSERGSGSVKREKSRGSESERGSNAETGKASETSARFGPPPASFPPPHAFSGSPPLHHLPSRPLAFPPRRPATRSAASPEPCSLHRARPPRGGCRTARSPRARGRSRSLLGFLGIRGLLTD